MKRPIQIGFYLLPASIFVLAAISCTDDKLGFKICVKGQGSSTDICNVESTTCLDGYQPIYAYVVAELGDSDSVPATIGVVGGQVAATSGEANPAVLTGSSTTDVVISRTNPTPTVALLPSPTAKEVVVTGTTSFGARGVVKVCINRLPPLRSALALSPATTLGDTRLTIRRDDSATDEIALRIRLSGAVFAPSATDVPGSQLTPGEREGVVAIPASGSPIGVDLSADGTGALVSAEATSSTRAGSIRAAPQAPYDGCVDVRGFARAAAADTPADRVLLVVSVGYTGKTVPAAGRAIKWSTETGGGSRLEATELVADGNGVARALLALAPQSEATVVQAQAVAAANCPAAPRVCFSRSGTAAWKEAARCPGVDGAGGTGPTDTCVLPSGRQFPAGCIAAVEPQVGGAGGSR